jgi:hypothetical protein
MKLLATALFTGMLAFGTVACAKEEPKKATPAATSPAAPAAPAAPASDSAGPGKGEMKEVCTDKKDKAGKVVNGKDGKPVQECKKIKVRKKVDGDKVPEKK